MLSVMADIIYSLLWVVILLMSGFKGKSIEKGVEGAALAGTNANFALTIESNLCYRVSSTKTPVFGASKLVNPNE